AREPETCIFTTDTPEMVKRKIWAAYTGGRSTVKEQKETGGEPDACTVYQYFLYLFEEDDGRIKERARQCRAGENICGDCKALLTERVTDFLLEHQRKREKAKDIIQEFTMRHKTS
ncbi:MAG: tryptophan--tRNA ligase, partial [Candidatus Bathyarchaeia archaeon]